MATKKKLILVKYTCVSGEYEFSGHTVMAMSSRCKPETQIHNYFSCFYGESNTCKDSTKEFYLYNGGEVGVKKISWHEISESDAEVLSRLNV